MLFFHLYKQRSSEDGLSIEVLSFTASGAKRIDSDNVEFTMSADGMWFSSNATGLTADEVLTNADLVWIVLESEATVSIELDADAQGQGMRIPNGLESIQVTSVTNTVKRLAMKDGNYGMTKATAYTDGSATTVTTDEYLNPGDYLVLSSTGKATVKFAALSPSTIPFTSFPIGLLVAAGR